MKKKILFIAISVLSLTAQASDFSGNIAVEGRYFPNDPSHANQEGNNLSLSVQPEYRHKWDKGRKKFTFIPFYRIDKNDNERSHGDIRTLDVVIANDNWEFQAGVSKVFWGVTESQHLVDIINQTDAVESPDGEDKLGQPLLRASKLFDNGSLDMYVLPRFRERTFPGEKGRLRTALPIDTDQASYESDDKENHVDYAVRWNQTIDNLDVGVHWFEGTSRDPELKLGTKNGKAVLTPYYSQIRQFGIDAQYTGEAWLWKLESIHRKNNQASYNAAVGGFEYTITGVADSSMDLGLLTEYHYDSRDEKATSPFQNDLFTGARLAFNDTQSTEVLVGLFNDLDHDGHSLRVEASRRLGDNFKLNIEAQAINNTEALDTSLYAIRNDDYLQIELQRFF